MSYKSQLDSSRCDILVFEDMSRLKLKWSFVRLPWLFFWLFGNHQKIAKTAKVSHGITYNWLFLPFSLLLILLFCSFLVLMLSVDQDGGLVWLIRVRLLWFWIGTGKDMCDALMSDSVVIKVVNCDEVWFFLRNVNIHILFLCFSICIQQKKLIC